MIKKILVVILVHVTVISSAQEGTSSPYSFYGLGLPKFKGTAENRSMGGLSIIGDSIHVNLQNPAAYGRLALTTYGIGASYNNFNFSNQTESSSGENASLDYLVVGIPAGRFGFGFGVMPTTSVGYELESSNGESRFTGEGGLNKVFVSTGFKVNKNISVGLDLNYNFGNIENKAILSRSGVQFDTREQNKINLSAFTMSFGMMYNAMITEKLELSLSASGAPSFSIGTERERDLATVLINSANREVVIQSQGIEDIDEDIDLPAELRVGGGIGEKRKWFVGAEYGYRGTEDFEDTFLTQRNVEYKNASIYKVGGYYISKYNSLTSYLSRVVYRAGFRYEETGFNINGESIDEFGISFGLGLPVGRLFSNVNLGFEYGQRGKTDFGLVKEEYFNFSLGLSLNDKWFRKIKYN